MSEGGVRSVKFYIGYIEDYILLGDKNIYNIYVYLISGKNMFVVFIY